MSYTVWIERSKGSMLRAQSMVVTPAVRTSRWSLPGAVPGALVTPGASKPGELLLHYFVEIPLRGGGHGGS